jgi:hypothetical protein
VPSVVSTTAPICASGPAIRSIGRRRSESSPVSSKRPGSPARTRPAGGSSYRLPQSIGSPGSRRREADALDAQRVRLVVVDRGPERANGTDRRLGVLRAAEAADTRLPSAVAPSRTTPGRSTCRQTAMCHAGRPPGRLHGASTGGTCRSPGLEQRGRSLGLARRSRAASARPAALRETWWSSKSSMLIRAPGAGIAASTPGRSGTERAVGAAVGIGVRISGIWRRLPAASPIQRARNPASPARARPPAARSGGGARPATHGAARRSDEDVDQMRVGARHSRHVAQRSARCHKRLMPPTRVAPPVDSGSRARAAGGWLRHGRSCAWIDRRAWLQRRDEPVNEPVAGGIRSLRPGSGTRLHLRRAPRGCSGPRASEPQTGCPPTRSAAPPSRRPPSSADVGDGRPVVAPSTACTWAASCATGAATTAELRQRRRAPQRGAFVDGAGRGGTEPSLVGIETGDLLHHPGALPRARWAPMRPVDDREAPKLLGARLTAQRGRAGGHRRVPSLTPPPPGINHASGEGVTCLYRGCGGAVAIRPHRGRRARRAQPICLPSSSAI